MQETNFYLVAYPPKQIQDEMMKIAKDVSEKFHTKTFVNTRLPHLTVWSGVFVPQDQIPELITDLQNIASTLQPVMVRTTWIGSIDNLNPKIAASPYVVYLDIDLTSNLQNIFDTLEQYEKFRKPWYAITTYSPHITLAYDDLTYAGFVEMLDYLKHTVVDYEFLLDTFCIVSLHPETKKREAYHTFTLGV